MKRQLPRVLLSSFRSSKRRPKKASPEATATTSMEADDEGGGRMEVDEAEEGQPQLPQRHAQHRRSLQLRLRAAMGTNGCGTLKPHFFQRHRTQPPQQQQSSPRPLSLDHSSHPHPDHPSDDDEDDDHPDCSCAVSASSSSGIGRSVSMENAALLLSNNDELPVKVAYVLEELLSTERSYVRELGEICTHYVQPFEALQHHVPHALRGQADVLFGNIRELLDFHQLVLLPALQQHAHSVHGVCAVLCAQRPRLLALYRAYCRNKPASEALRAEHAADACKLFTECQRRAGHLLPLSAYLLKPIQRITKYQLLLKELVRHSAPTPAEILQSALACMLDVLAQINADMEQLHILGYPGDLRLLGALRLRTECEVYSFKRAKSSGGSASASSDQQQRSRRSATKGKHQKRHLFLFDGGVLFCKKRAQPQQNVAEQLQQQQQSLVTSEYYEHKLCIPMHSLGFAAPENDLQEDCFELWDVHSAPHCYAIRPLEERARAKWTQRLARLTQLHKMHESMPPLDLQHGAKHAGGKSCTRPQSWTTTSSSEGDGTPMMAPRIGGADAAGGGGSSRSSTTSSSASSSSAHFEDAKDTAMSASCPPADNNNDASSASCLELRARSQPPLQLEAVQ